MRRTAILLALVPVCALLYGCGKGGNASTASHPPAPTTTSGAAKTGGGKGSGSSTPTRAQALAFAHAVNLTAADVPGFTPSPKQHNETPAERHLEQELHACIGSQGREGSQGGQGAQSTQGALAEASSPNYELRRGILDLTVSSEVSVAHSAAAAAATLAASRNARVRGCMTRYLTQLLKSQHYSGATVTGVSIASGTPPAPGTTGGFGWRVTATLAIRGIRVSFYLDLL